MLAAGCSSCGAEPGRSQLAPLLRTCRTNCPAPACLPRRIVRFFAQPWAMQRATYSRWWTVIKKEAKHYWVGGWSVLAAG